MAYQRTDKIEVFSTNGPLLTLAVANGFTPETYKPMLAPLIAKYHVISLLPRALWGDELPPQQLHSWKAMLAQDMAEIIQANDLRAIIGVGHSFGAIGTLLTAIALPDRFKALVLLDPTILPRPALWMIRLAQVFKLQNPFAKRAEIRRFRFDTVDDAFTYFRPKQLFHDWSDEVLHLYAQSLKPHPDGGLQLRWPREWEAYYFRTMYKGIWRELPKLRETGLPTLILRGGDSDTLKDSVASKVQEMAPNVTYREVAGHGHLFPHTVPVQTGALIMSWLDDLQMV